MRPPMIALPPPYWMRYLMVLLVAVALISFALQGGCKGPHHAAWTTLDAVQRARDLTAQQLAGAARAKHQACLQAHQRKTPEFAACIKKHREALDHWKKIARPAINNSIQVTATALQIAEKVKAKADAMALMRPAACALMRVARAWGHYYPDKGASILSALKLFEGVACE